MGNNAPSLPPPPHRGKGILVNDIRRKTMIKEKCKENGSTCINYNREFNKGGAFFRRVENVVLKTIIWTLKIRMKKCAADKEIRY